MGILRHHKDGRVHFSELKQLSESPAHYRYAVMNPKEPTRAMTVGSIADRLVFGGQKVAIYPGKTRNGKEWEAFRTEYKDCVICIQSEYDDAVGAADAVKNDPIAAGLLLHNATQHQRVMQWDAYGVQCAAGIAGERGGFDALNEEAGFIADLKITADVSPRGLERHVWRMHWAQQGAWYVDGAAALGMAVSDFYLVCVEATPPHCVTVLHLQRPVLDFARRSLVQWSETLRGCEASGNWHGYQQTPVVLDVPSWGDEE